MRNEGEKKTKFKIDDLPSKSFSSFLLFFNFKIHVYLYACAHSSISHNCQNVEATQVSLKGDWVCKMWCIHLIAYYTAVERKGIMTYIIAWMNTCKWKKPVTKEQIVHDLHIQVRSLEELDSESKRWVAGARCWGWGWGVSVQQYTLSFARWRGSGGGWWWRLDHSVDALNATQLNTWKWLRG